jgi:hypothetical protein
VKECCKWEVVGLVSRINGLYSPHLLVIERFVLQNSVHAGVSLSKNLFVPLLGFLDGEETLALAGATFVFSLALSGLRLGGDILDLWKLFLEELH